MSTTTVLPQASRNKVQAELVLEESVLTDKIRISVLGLGYVGAVSCACFSMGGFTVIGVDVSRHKVDLINRKESPIVEADLDGYISEGVSSGKIKATVDLKKAILETDISIICVGTPSQLNGNIDLNYIRKVCAEIGEVLREKETFHSVVIRSTVVPGTVKECIHIIEQASGKAHLESFGVASNPEFLREGTAVYDFWNPPYTVVGTESETTKKQLSYLYNNIKAPFISLKPEEAEMIKYANNNFHALKITFANEIGNICKELGVDGYKVMQVVAQDKKLNLSDYYMKPGFAFGGSCLPKDVRGLIYKAKTIDVKTPLINSLLESNQEQIQRGLQLVYNTGKRRIGVLGFAFKDGTDDLRESPMVTMIETLLGKGYELSLYDSNVILSNLMGKNKEYINSHIPHIAKLLKGSIKEVIDTCDVIILGNKSREFLNILKLVHPETIVVDLVRIDPTISSGGNYVGICW